MTEKVLVLVELTDEDADAVLRVLVANVWAQLDDGQILLGKRLGHTGYLPSSSTNGAESAPATRSSDCVSRSRISL